MPIDTIPQRLVIETLEGIAIGKGLVETAKRCRFSMREIFGYAMVMEYVAHNPAGEVMRDVVKRWASRRIGQPL